MAGRDQTKSTTHEVFSREEKIVAGSDRSFGFVMAGAFAIVTAINVWHVGPYLAVDRRRGRAVPGGVPDPPGDPQSAQPALAEIRAAAARIVNPVIMALLFFGTVLPTGLVMRALGKDLLRLKRQPDADSYWIVRQPPGPSPETMKDQF